MKGLMNKLQKNTIVLGLAGLMSSVLMAADLFVAMDGNDANP